MTTYTVEIQAGNEDGTIWQALAPAENVEAIGDESAEDVAVWTAKNQTVADGGNWRVMVWDGADAETDDRTAVATYFGGSTDPESKYGTEVTYTATVGAERAEFLASPEYQGAFTDLGGGRVAVNLPIAQQIDPHTVDAGQVWIGGIGYPISES
jgi:hypothetical protein